MIEYLLVLLGAAIPWLEIALVIPVAIVTGLNPVLVVLLAFIGNMITIFPLIIGFDKLKQWLMKKQNNDSKRSERARKLWDKYGLPGMLLLGPILIGSHIAAFIGMTLGASKQATMTWSIISIAGWSLIFGLVTALGFDLFVQT